MPRPFSDRERRQVRSNIVTAARREFSEKGYRKANIAAIARTAGCGKGTIYLFFHSKAEMFVTVLEQVEQELRSELLLELDRGFDEPRQRLEFFFRAILARMIDHPLLWVVVDPREAAALFEDLGPEAEVLRSADEGFFRELVSEWREAGWLAPIEPAAFAGAGRALYAVALHRDLIGDAYPRVVELLVQSLARELAPR